jgi:hypothetical protein
MKSKAVLAILLNLVFVVKFIAIEANGLNTLLNGNGFKLVKTFCKKERADKTTNTEATYLSADNNAMQEIALSSMCTSPFQFDLFSWETNILEPIAALGNHFPSNLIYRYLENDSPPPRWA